MLLSGLCLARSQEITTQPPIHSKAFFDPTQPMMTIQGSTNQTGDLFDWFDQTGALGCAVTAAAALNCKSITANSFNPSSISTNSLSVTGNAALNTLSASGATALNSLSLSGAVSGFQDKGGQVFNVLAYGAKCDGSTDDTTSINAALSAAKAAHGILFFPSGTCDYSSPLNFTNIADMTIRGSGVSSSVIFATPSSTVLKYTGPALASTCPVEFTNSYWLWVEHLSFTSQNSVACQVLLGSSSGESFHINFFNVDVGIGAKASVADASAEQVSFMGDSNIAFSGGAPGFLLSDNGLSGYGIGSNFGYTFSARSTTQYYFSNTTFANNGGNNGHGVEFDATGGGGLTISDLNFIGDFYQGSASGAAAFYVKGIVQGLNVQGARFEVDSQTGNAYFIEAAPSAILESFNITNFNPSTAGGGSIYALYAPTSAEIQGMRLTGLNNAISWNGNIVSLDLKTYASLNVLVTGNLTQSSLDEQTGYGAEVLAVSGSMDIALNGLPNVVHFANLGSGTNSYTLTGTGKIIATYAGDVCTFNFSSWFATYVVQNPQSLHATAGTMNCPTAGSGSTAITLTATYTNTGSSFVIQEF